MNVYQLLGTMTCTVAGFTAVISCLAMWRENR